MARVELANSDQRNTNAATSAERSSERIIDRVVKAGIIAAGALSTRLSAHHRAIVALCCEKYRDESPSLPKTAGYVSSAIAAAGTSVNKAFGKTLAGYNNQAPSIDPGADSKKISIT